MTACPAGLDGVTFQSHGRKLLGGLYRAHGHTPRPTVVLLHGIPGVEQNRDLAAALRDAGFNCLFFHYRGCWGSQGDYSITGLADDVGAAADWVARQPCVDAGRLALAGNSLGGYLTLAVGALDARFKALVPICPLVDPAADRVTRRDFDDYAAMLNGTSGAALEAQWRVLTPVAQLRERLADRPALLITADRDELFPPEHYALFDAGWPRLTRLRLAEADHSFSRCRPQLVAAVVSWLGRWV